MAFDVVHRLRTSQPLSVHRVRALSLLLDFGAHLNAVCDGKPFCAREFQQTKRLLTDAGVSQTARDYWRQILQLESRRPSACGERIQCQDVRTYREATVRLSLGVLSKTAFGSGSLDDGIQAVYSQEDLKMLFRIVMQCQIIDDVVDYAKDLAQGLPGFLTSSESLRDAFSLTSHASRCYANDSDEEHAGRLFPLQVALFAVSATSRLLITLGRWRQGVFIVEPFAERRADPERKQPEINSDDMIRDVH